MDWIKKNTTLVVSIVVALIAIGGAGYYLSTQMAKNTEASNALNSAIQRRNGYIRKNNNHPGFERVDNVKIVKEDIARLESFKSDLIKGFRSTTPVDPTERDFKRELSEAIMMVSAASERTGMNVPTNFSLSFTAQKVSYQYASNSLDQLSLQLADLREIARILVDARVNGIEEFKRVPVSSDDRGRNAVEEEYLTRGTITTNEATGAVVYPYEITFEAFSEEIGAVLENIAKSPYSILVKTLSVEPSEVRELSRRAGGRGGYSAADLRRRSAAANAPGVDPRRFATSVDPRAGSGRTTDPRVTRDTRTVDPRGGDPRTRQAGRGRNVDPRSVDPRNQVVPGAMDGATVLQMQPTGPEVLLQPEPLSVTLGLVVIRMPQAEADETANN